MHTDEMFTITPETFIKVNSIRFNFMLSLSFWNGHKNTI